MQPVLRTAFEQRFLLASVLSALLLAAAPVHATPPSATRLAQQMKGALEPAQTSVRKLTIVVSTPDGQATQVIAGQARKPSPDGGRVLTVILEPPDQRGIALLVEESRKGGAVEQWLYYPVVRRVRRIIPVEGFQPFLGSDFTLADMGFVSLRATYKLLAQAAREGQRAYEIQEVPLAPHAKWYYSRIVTWIAADSSLPIERDFYDPSNTLWKVEHVDRVSEVGGVPTPLHFRMEDRQENEHTDITVSDVRYGADIPDSLLEPAHLREAVDARLW